MMFHLMLIGVGLLIMAAIAGMGWLFDEFEGFFEIVAGIVIAVLLAWMIGGIAYIGRQCIKYDNCMPPTPVAEQGESK